jgi:hypothetical protein
MRIDDIHFITNTVPILVVVNLTVNLSNASEEVEYLKVPLKNVRYGYTC